MFLCYVAASANSCSFHSSSGSCAAIAESTWAKEVGVAKAIHSSSRRARPVTANEGCLAALKLAKAVKSASLLAASQVSQPGS